jgi:NADPH:quinone reductase-like Zn-dependent oxidoreductase
LFGQNYNGKLEVARSCNSSCPECARAGGVYTYNSFGEHHRRSIDRSIDLDDFFLSKKEPPIGVDCVAVELLKRGRKTKQQSTLKMRLPPTDRDKRWNHYQDPEEVTTSNGSMHYGYRGQQNQRHASSRPSVEDEKRRGVNDDAHDAAAIMNKIMEFEQIVNTSDSAPRMQNHGNYNHRFASGGEKIAAYYNDRREGPPSEDRHSTVGDSRQGKSLNSGYTTRSSRSGSASIPERALADALSPQDSQYGSVAFFPPQSGNDEGNKLNRRGASQTYPTKTNHAMVVKENNQEVGLAMAADFASFIKSPCHKLNSTMSEDDIGQRQRSKIWDILDPKEDVTQLEDRTRMIRKKKQEKRALEEAYRDLMLISPDKDHYHTDRRPSSKRTPKQGSIKVKGCGVTSSQPTCIPSPGSHDISTGSHQTDSSMGSSDVHHEMWGPNSHPQRASDDHFTVSSDIPQSNATTRASAFYPRTSDPYRQGGGVIKTSNLRRQSPSQQKIYPTKDDLNGTPTRRVQFSKSIDPELHRHANIPNSETKQNISILNGCTGGDCLDDGQSINGTPETDDDTLEKLRQELWAAKLNTIFPKQETEASNESSAINCITGDLRQLEQTIKNQVYGQNIKKTIQISDNKKEADENMNAGRETIPSLVVPNRKTYMYVAYSRFSDQADEVLQLCEHASIPSPNRKVGEVLVKVKACTISFSDCEVRRGARTEVELSPYIIPGTAFCGQIPLTEKKSSFSKIVPGDVVISLRRSGSNARYVCAPKDHLVKVPRKINPEEAACLVETYLTAFQALHLGHKSAIRYRDNSLKGRTILIMVGGFSCLSRALMEVANAGGVECCYVLVEKDEFEATSKFGAIPLSKDPQQWLTLVGKQIDLLVACNDHDMRTESVTKDHLKALNNEGEVVFIGKPGVDNCLPFTENSATSASKLICKRSRRNLQDRCQSYNVFDAWDKDLQQSKRDLEHLLFLLKNHRVRPQVLQRLPLSKIATAQSIIESKKLSGYFVCLPWAQETVQPKNQ